MYPNRSGGQTAYLEQAFPKPAFLFPVTYAFFTVVFSFSSSNAVVLARYIYRAAGYSATEWENKGLAMASYSFLALLVSVTLNYWPHSPDLHTVFDLDQMVHPAHEPDLTSEADHPALYRHNRIRCTGRRNQCPRSTCQLPQFFRWYYQ